MTSIDPKPRILVVDDDRLIRSLIRDALEAEGFAVSESPDGRHALEAVEEETPDLIILDLKMPGQDGFEVCRALRSRHGPDAIPILVASAALDNESIDRAYRAGASDFLVKPINWALLVHRAHQLIRNSRSFIQVKQNETSLATAQRIARVGSWEWNTKTDEMRWSDEVFRILGMVPGKVEVGFESFLDRIHADDRDSVRNQVREAVLLSQGFTVQHRMIRPGGDVCFIHQQGEPISEELRPGNWIYGTIQDITEQRRDQDRIRYLANYDSLTGLANRRLFKERLARTIDQAEARGTLAALLFLDLDRFKRINDTLGHSAGDQLLRVVADRLRDRVRGSDIVGRAEEEEDSEPVSRLGGDEFTVLLSKISDPKDAGEVAQRILESLPEPIEVDGHSIWTTGSIGIAIYPMDGKDVETLVKNADTAMYHAKERSRNNYHFYSEAMNASLVRKLSLETRLREALNQNEFRLHYQPRIDLQTGEICGMEALIRWEHPDLGVVSPKEFIPVTEEAGLIHEIGNWVMRTACAQNRAWQDAGLPRMPVSVNVSSKQFTYNDITESIVDALKQTNLDPTDLEIEITESVMIKDDEATAESLRAMRAMGVRVALDDFGTGYSSLSYLTRFPLDTLKMDLSFIRDVATDPSAAGIVTAVISMAHCLNLRVVAEGVDDEEQARILKGQGCDEVQGFLYSGALAPDDFIAFVKKNRAS